MSTTDEDRKTKTDATGAEGQGSTGSSLPFEPSKDDDTPVGDTDQHSKVDHGHDPAEDIKEAGAKD